MRKLINNIKKLIGFNSQTVWGKYMKFIIPCFMVVIVAMDIAIYAIIASYTNKTSSENSQMRAKIIADDISEVFHRYLGDLVMMRHYYNKCNREEFMDFARSFTDDHSNKYAYIRLSLPDGDNFHTLGNQKDSYQVKTSRPYKYLVMQHKEVSVNSAHKSELVDYDVYSISVPVRNSRDSVMAIISAVIPADVIDQKMFLAAKDTTEYYILIDEEQYIRVCYHGRAFNTTLGTTKGARFVDAGDIAAKNKQRAANGGSKYGSAVLHDAEGQETLLHYVAIPDTPWSVAHLTQKRIIARDVTLTLWVLLLTTLVAIIVLLVAIRYITARVVIRPLEAINRFSDDFARGKLYSTETHGIQTDDEIGIVCKNIEKMQQRLVSAVAGIHETSSDLQRCSTNVVGTVQSVDSDAQVQNLTVERIDDAADKLVESIRLTTDDALRTRTNSEDIASDIVSVSKATADTYECMQSIVQKVKVINDITSRTDLLAINASVEASRAGEHGYGFAVVAAEIRKLSEHCHRASTEINRLSEVSLAATTETVNLVGSITPKIHDNAEMVSRIADACNKQLQLTDTISGAVKQLSTIAQNNTCSADKLTVYAGELVSDILRLNKLVDFFRLERDKDLRRDDIMSAIEVCKSEIYLLKSRLIEISDTDDESVATIGTKIDEAIQSAQDLVQSINDN